MKGGIISFIVKVWDLEDHTMMCLWTCSWPWEAPAGTETYIYIYTYNINIYIYAYICTTFFWKWWFDYKPSFLYINSICKGTRLYMHLFMASGHRCGGCPCDTPPVKVLVYFTLLSNLLPISWSLNNCNNLSPSRCTCRCDGTRNTFFSKLACAELPVSARLSHVANCQR